MNQAQFNFFRCPIISFENLVRLTLNLHNKKYTGGNTHASMSSLENKQKNMLRVFYARVHLPNSFFLREPIATSG